MACAKPNNCAPCSKCPDSPAPVVGRCEGAIPNDGTFTNATVVIENGCVVSVTEGTPLLYQPDNNCAGAGGGGGGGETLLPDPGEPGPAGTIQIGTISTLAPGSPVTIDNVGTPSAAVLNIGIPAGPAGTPAPALVGGANSTAGALVVEFGRIMEPLPVVWPPVFDVVAGAPVGAGVSIGFTKNPANGVITAVLDVSGLISSFQAQIDALQVQIDDHQARLVVLETP